MPLVPPLDASPDEVRSALEPLRADFSVALYAADNAFAVGAVVRVAHSFLAKEVILVGSEPFYEKASMGMERYETLVRVADDEALFAHVDTRPVWAFEKERATASLYGAGPFPRGVVFLFGSERRGLPEVALARASRVVAIPIYGVNNSLPLAVAAGIVMSEHARRRFAEGSLL